MAPVSMRLSISIAVFVCTLALAWSPGCVSTSLKPVEDGDFTPDQDEKELWDKADAVDQRIREAGVLYADETLQAYLRKVANRLLPFLGARDIEFRLYVISDPLLNALALANGSIYLHTGLLARAENEAQLAMILGHELAHYIHRDNLKELRIAKNKQSAEVVGAILMAAIIGTAPTPRSLPEHLAKVQVSGYSRDVERRADTDSMKAMVDAGYDPREIPSVFEQMMEQRDAEGFEEPYFYGSHPRLEERIENWRKLLGNLDRDGPADSSGDTREQEFARAIADLLLHNARLDLKLARWRVTRRQIERHLEVRPKSVDGYRLLGELHQARPNDPDERQSAIRAYRAMLEIDPEQACGYRELGLLFRANGEREEARRALKRYLELSPDAIDRLIIEGYLGKLEEPRNTETSP